MSEILLEGNKWHNEGFALIWLMPKSKRPLEAGWTQGPRHEWDKLKETYRQGFNLGVRTGEPSRLPDGSYLAIIDVDIKGDEQKFSAEVAKALQALDPCLLTGAPKVLSGRKGGSHHVYIRTKEPLESQNLARSLEKVQVFMPSVAATQRDIEVLGKVKTDEGFRVRSAWEIDLLGSGKQAVMPPSIHPDSGLRYTWQVPPQRWSDIPLVDIKGRLSALRPANKKAEAALNFQRVDINVSDDARIPDTLAALIVNGEGVDNYPSRSEAIGSVIVRLVNLDLSDNEIISILTDELNFIAEKALEKGSGAIRWVKNQITKYRDSRSAEAAFKNAAVEERALTPAEAESQAAAILDWTNELAVSDKGAIKNTTNNIKLILSNVAGANPFYYHEIRDSVFYSIDVPWSKTSTKGKEVGNNTLNEIMVYLSNNYKIEVGTDKINSVVEYLAHLVIVNPIKLYLETLQYDGKSRIDTWLTKYMGAEDSAYTRAVGRKLLLAMIKRIYEPGCKFDYVVVLEGDQGVGKSTALSILGGEWFSDTLGDLHYNPKDVIANMQGVWLLEIGELSALSKAETTAIKEFVSRTVDRVRMPYTRRKEDYPRRLVFVGTTNKDEYLKDETGARRFWPVPVGDIGPIDLESLKKDRDQLFAETFAYYQIGGEPLYLDDKKAAEIAKEEQSIRYIEDELVEEFNAALESLGEVTSMRAVADALGILDLDRATQNRLAQMLARAGYKRKVMRENGKSCRRWSKKVFKWR